MNQRKVFGTTRLLVTFLLVGSLFAFTSVVYAFSPDTDLSNANASFWGEDVNDYSGYSVASAGDANGDGYDDFLIGAYNDEDGGIGAGQTYLLLGTGPTPTGGTVGWETYPINRLAVMAPWIALFGAIIAGALIFMRRRRAQS